MRAMSDDEDKEVGFEVQTRVTFEWIVGDFFSLSDKVGDCYFSPNFEFANMEWYLSLHPNEMRGKSQGWVGLYLHREEEGTREAFTLRFGIKVPGGVEEKRIARREFSKRCLKCGISNFSSRSVLSNRRSTLMPDNELTITCDLRSDHYFYRKVDPPAIIPQGPAPLFGEKKCLNTLLGMLESGDDSDVVIKVQGKEFPAHRNILRARSDVFRSMLAHEVVEKNSRVVNIEDCDPGTFKDFLVHIYSGSCVLTSENVYSLYVSADKYNVGELKEVCSDFMKKSITVENFCQIITLAVKHNDWRLTLEGRYFFCNNSVNIIKTTEWQTFLRENPRVANGLLTKSMDFNDIMMTRIC